MFIIPHTQLTRLAILAFALSCLPACKKLPNSPIFPIEAQASNPIFLQKITPKASKTVLIQSNQPYLHSQLKVLLRSHNARITQDPMQANVIIQMESKYLGMTDELSAFEALNQGYGIPLPAMNPKITERSPKEKYTWSQLSQALRKRMNKQKVYQNKYLLAALVDIQVSERDSTLAWHRHQTRLLSSTDHYNIDPAVAAPKLHQTVAKNINQLFHSS